MLRAIPRGHTVPALWMPCVVGLLFAQWVGVAHSDEVHLAWQACAANGGVPSEVFACNTNSGSNVLVGSVVPGQNITFLGQWGFQARLTLRDQYLGSTLPNWWSFAGAGCRPNALTVTFDVPMTGGCMNPFVGTVASTTPVVTVVTLPDPHGSQTIERVTFAASTQDLGALVAGTEYQLFQIHVPHAATRNAGACSGCCTPMWLTLDVLELSDATGTRLLPESNTVSWQGEGSPCQATRGAPATWGSIRSLYR